MERGLNENEHAKGRVMASVHREREGKCSFERISPYIHFHPLEGDQAR